jgi:transposase
MDSVIQAVLGLDVSKAKVHCALLAHGKSKSKVIKNDPDGFKELTVWIGKQDVPGPVHACCESTNIYHEALATYLADAGHLVSVLNPAVIKSYAQSQLTRAKTDKADAHLIAQFCEREKPACWLPPPPPERLLLALVRDLNAVQNMRTAESNRLDTAHPSVKDRIQGHLDFLDADIARIKQAISKLIDDNDDLRGRRALLESIPGIGEATSAWLLAYLGDGTRFTGGKQAVAFAGLAPQLRESGTSLHGKASIAKTGHADLRRILYMPGVAALRMPAYKSFITRLRNHGKPGKLIVVALMRKLLTIANAVLKSGKPFNPALHST